MYVCYFDDAGNERDGFKVVAGWISTLERWRSFSEEWSLMLTSFSVPHFDMKTLSHFKDVYEDWNTKRWIKDDFQNQACRIINKNLLYSFACIVPCKRFKTVDKHYKLKPVIGNEYALAGLMCVQDALRWARRREARSCIEFIFDDGTPKKGHLINLMKAEHCGEPIFRSPYAKNGLRAVTQLQAADFLAYEVRKIMVNDPEDTWNVEQFRQSVRHLVSVDSEWSIVKEADLIQTCENHPRIERRVIV